jgi:hypothetical protein
VCVREGGRGGRGLGWQEGTHVCVCVCMSACVCVCVCEHVCASVCVFLHVCAYVCRYVMRGVREEIMVIIGSEVLPGFRDLNFY